MPAHIYFCSPAPSAHRNTAPAFSRRKSIDLVRFISGSFPDVFVSISIPQPILSYEKQLLYSFVFIVDWLHRAISSLKKQRPDSVRLSGLITEMVGVEPTRRKPTCRISSAVPSTSWVHLHAVRKTSCKNCFQTQHLYSIVIFSILQVLNMTSSQYLHRMLYRLLIRIFFHFYLPCIFSVALRFFPFYGTGQDKGHFSTSRSCQLIQYGGGQDDG